MGRRVKTATLDGTASAGACSYPCRLKLLVCLECLPQSLAPSDWVQKPPAKAPIKAAKLVKVAVVSTDWP